MQTAVISRDYSLIRTCFRAVIVVIISGVLLNGSDADQTLEKLSSCSCALPNGTMVDLSSLAGSGGKPRFADLPDKSGSMWHYSYNPCNPFTQTEPGAVQGTLCKDVAICQHTTNPGSTQLLYFNLGTQDSVKYELKSSTSIREMLNPITRFTDDVITAEEYVTFTYYDNVASPKRTGMVVLTCSQTSSFVVVGAINPGTTPAQFVFELADPAACPVPHGGGGSGGLSVGSVLCIVFFVCLAVYLIAGILIMKFARKAEGSDVIPNKVFWTEVPLYIKDGCKFTYAVVTRKSVDNYASI